VGAGDGRSGAGDRAEEGQVVSQLERNTDEPKIEKLEINELVLFMVETWRNYLVKQDVRLF